MKNTRSLLLVLLTTQCMTYSILDVPCIALNIVYSFRDIIYSTLMFDTIVGVRKHYPMVGVC